MTELAIIGAGSLGSRHLQALAKLRRAARVIVVDPSRSSLEQAAARFAEMGPTATAVSFAETIDAVDRPLDVAIIATNADIRADVIRALLSLTTVGALILEKVLFTTPKDYIEIGDLLRLHGVKAWVNCARRAWPFYQALKDRLASTRMREMNASGMDWGLGCNSIHMLDLAAWLSGSNSYAITALNLDEATRPSKRQGFIELTGAFSGVFQDGPVFRMASWPVAAPSGMPFMLHIVADEAVYVIREVEGAAWVADGRSGWQWQNIPCGVIRQSDLTHLIVDEILERNTAPLTPYEESVALHTPMLAAFMRHLQSRKPTVPLASCPIT